MMRGPTEHLRTILMQVGTDGRITVTVDGDPLPEPVDGWRRDAFATVVDLATCRRRYPAKVEVQETDGSIFTDLLPPARTPTTPATAGQTSPTDTTAHVTGSGFLPGEEVAVAVIVEHRHADRGGAVDAAVQLPGLLPTTGLILVGRTSGTLHLEPQP